MAQKRALKERLGLVSANPKPEPDINIPAADSAKNLAEAAESGFAAIQELFADRNKSVELAQSLHRHNVYLLNVNNSLRGELVHARQERDYYMKLNARIQAWVAQAHDILGRVYCEIGQTAVAIEAMEAVPVPTNNPTAPELDTVGRPIIEQDYDNDGRPHSGPPPVSPDELRVLASKLANGSGAVQ